MKSISLLAASLAALTANGL
jgi:hypothetical protein